MSTAFSWVEDPKAETALKEAGVSYRIETVPLGSVDWGLTNDNPARAGRKTDDSYVESIAKSIALGNRLPSPVGVYIKNRLVIICGVHRTKAATLAKVRDLRVYIAETDLPVHFLLVASIHNRIEGHGLSDDVAVHRALELCDQHGMTHAQAASAMRLSKSVLTSYMRAARVEQQAKEGGFLGVLTKTHFDSLQRLTPNTKVLSAACALLRDAKIPCGDQVTKIVRDVAGIKTEAQQLAHIERLAEKHRRDAVVTSATPVKLNRRTVFLRAFRALDSAIGTATDLAGVQIVADSDEHKSLRADWKALRAKINNIIA